MKKINAWKDYDFIYLAEDLCDVKYERMFMKKIIKKLLEIILISVLLLNVLGCESLFSSGEVQVKEYEKPKKSSSGEEEKNEKMDWEEALGLAAEYYQKMTLEEKVCQLFVVNLEQLDPSKGSYYEHTKVTEQMKETLRQYPVGGVILFSRNIAKREQTAKLNEELQNSLVTPLFVMVDEEGGSVARIGSNKKMGTTSFPSAEEIGTTQNDTYTYNMGKTIGKEMKELGFNVDLAPVADVKTNDLNAEIGNRSFGDDPQKVSQYVNAFVQGLDQQNISATLKHFPGQGSSGGDTHEESVDIDSTIASLRKTDFLPFKNGIAAGADFIMVSHISVSKVTESSIPASMSDLIMQTILRDELSFEKIIITDAFDMASITEYYTAGAAATHAIKAGADIVLMPEHFIEAFDEVLAMVEDGTYDEGRLEDTVLRILAVKIQRGILTEEQIKEKQETIQTPEPETPEPTATVIPKKKKSTSKKRSSISKEKSNPSKKEK